MTVTKTRQPISFAVVMLALFALFIVGAIVLSIAKPSPTVVSVPVPPIPAEGVKPGLDPVVVRVIEILDKRPQEWENTMGGGGIRHQERDISIFSLEPEDKPITDVSLYVRGVLVIEYGEESDEARALILALGRWRTDHLKAKSDEDRRKLDRFLKEPV